MFENRLRTLLIRYYIDKCKDVTHALTTTNIEFQNSTLNEEIAFKHKEFSINNEEINMND